MSYEPDKNKEYLKSRYHAQRKLFYALLGGRCVKCGSNESLEIDHIDPHSKSFNINRLWPEYKLPEVLVELKKCQLLCKTHHVDKSKIDLSGERGWKHGTYYSIMRKKCKCQTCLDFKDQFNQQRRVARGSNKQYGRPVEHGEYLCYKRGCRCDLCKIANAKKAREYRTKQVGHIR